MHKNYFCQKIENLTKFESDSPNVDNFVSISKAKLTQSVDGTNICTEKWTIQHISVKKAGKLFISKVNLLWTNNTVNLM